MLTKDIIFKNFSGTKNKKKIKTLSKFIRDKKLLNQYPLLKSLFRMNDKYFDVLYKTTKIISITYLLLGITESAFTGVNDITAILYLSVWIIMVHFCFSNEMFLKMNNYHRVSH